ncbi:uncharacterized protein LOC115595306 [Sparus aurata]|uniref:uncharacterized protein LOC115595306 n=1 Tax=Sparus aurata TaxID=8175 RepID=UPI0011C1CA2B|nr:uncharacterized protein LOC115595306 [Sparus aurata]
MAKVSAFSAQRYIIDDTATEKLRTLLTGSRDETKVITTINRKFPLSIKDIRSVCPVELLGESAWVMPWLTDDAVNYRVAQLARGNSETAALGHFDFILWHRQWIKNKNVDDSLLNHLPVLDFSKKEICVYDSLKTMTSIDEDDMDLLRNVFRKRGGLKDWRETYHVQWRQKDSVNCGIFVCSAAENEVNKLDVQEEGLTMTQCRILRRFHGAEMIKNVDEAIRNVDGNTAIF